MMPELEIGFSLGYAGLHACTFNQETLPHRRGFLGYNFFYRAHRNVEVHSLERPGHQYKRKPSGYSPEGNVFYDGSFYSIKVRASVVLRVTTDKGTGSFDRVRIFSLGSSGFGYCVFADVKMRSHRTENNNCSRFQTHSGSLQ